MENNTTVTVTVDLAEVAKGVRTYYDQMSDGQLAEMTGDIPHAFEQAKKVIGTLAGIVENIVGRENVGRVNELVYDNEAAGK